MSLGEKILYYRKRKGWSQEKLAEKLEVSRQSISKWELDQTMPEIASVKTLSKLFDVSIDSLLNDEEFEYETISNPISNTPPTTSKFELVLKKYWHLIGYVLIIWGLFGLFTSALLPLSLVVTTSADSQDSEVTIINEERTIISDVQEIKKTDFDDPDIITGGYDNSDIKQNKSISLLIVFMFILIFLYHGAKIALGIWILKNHKKKMLQTN